jgi:DNA-binding response OmpR family regulator
MGSWPERNHVEPATQATSLGANLLVVDDEYAARRTLVNLLRHSGYEVSEASHGKGALELITRHRYDLVILDLKMPDMDGTEVLAQARPLARDTVFIILTAFGTMDSAVTALRHGAFDYLLKPSSLQDIIRSVEAGLAERRRRLNPEDPVALLERALAGLKSSPHESAPASASIPASAPESDRFLQTPDVTVDTLRRLVVVRGQRVDLTPTEFDILVYLLQRQDRVVSSRELAAHLRGCEMDERDARLLLRTHIHRLRQKLELDPSRPRILCTARGSGFCIGGEA